MPDRSSQANRIIDEYISRNKGLKHMQDIHSRVFDESVEFQTWESVEDKYDKIDWNEEKYNEFVLTARQVVEGGLERISETYFNVNTPQLTEQQVQSRLNSFLYEERTKQDEPNGFKYEITDDGVFNISYIHTDIRIDITATAEIREQVSEDSISFRIHPDQQLVVVEATYPPDVQRMKSVLGKKLDFGITVTGDLTDTEGDPNQMVDNLQDSLGEVEIDDAGSSNVSHDDDDDIVKLDDIAEVFLFNTNEREEDIEKIDYQGKSLSGNDTIQERIDGGYITRGFTAKVWFNGEQFDISFSASEMMGYAKVENINDYNEASKLMNKIRKKYMKHLREY